MIDLEQFVNKDVIITCNNDYTFYTTVSRNRCAIYSYICNKWEYTRNGLSNYSDPYDPWTIQKIQLKTCMNPQPDHTQKHPIVSESTVNKIADALAQEAVEYIQNKEEYVTFMTELLTEFVRERVGQMNPDVECEVVSSLCVDKISLNLSNSQK